MQPGSSSFALDRNATERNRRTQMKDLYSRLASLIPNQNSKERVERLPVGVMLDQASDYVVQLKQNVEELVKGRKALLEGDEGSSKDETAGSMAPVVALREMGSTLEVNLITGLNKNFMLHEVFKVLEEEGAEVVSASYSTVGDKIFYTIYSKAFSPRIGIQTSRVHERLEKLVC